MVKKGGRNKTFESEIIWSSVYNVREVKHWFLMCHDKESLGADYMVFADSIKSQEEVNYKLPKK